MYILSHFFKDLLKNKLKVALDEFSNNLINEITDCLTSNINEEKYFPIISKVQEHERNLIIKVIKDIFESIDEQYKNSSNRKTFYIINKSNVSRTITTIFGEVQFMRTYYESKLDGSLHFILDEVLGLPKYDKYDPIVKAMATNTYAKSNLSLAGQIIGERLTNLSNLGINESIKTIPRQSIYNWIKDWSIPKTEYELKETPKILYIMADEKFIGCQDLDGDIMIKSFVVFEGVENVSKGRRKLVNKTVINLISAKPWEEFSEILFQMYNPEIIENIYLLGDGASWIKSGISELKVEENMDIKFLLCEFHYKQAINHITTDKDERDILKLSFKDDSKKEFNNYIEEIKRENPNRLETITKKQTYILKNYSYIKNMLASNIGSSMEGHISHHVANQFGSRPKGYSSKRIHNYLDISNYYNNGFNIFNLYIKSYNNEEVITLREKDINYSISERKSRTNIPTLESGCNSTLNLTLNEIIHNKGYCI